MDVNVCMCGNWHGYFLLSLFTYVLRWSSLEPVSSGDPPISASLVLRLQACGRCLYLLRLLSLTNFMCIVIIDEYVHIKNQPSELFFNLQNWFILLLTYPALLLGVKSLNL